METLKQTILIIEGLHNSLRDIETNITHDEWANFSRTCSQQFLTNEMGVSPTWARTALNACLEPLRTTGANAIVKRIWKEAEEKARNIELGIPELVSFKRPKARDQHLDVRLLATEFVRPDVVVGAMGILVMDLIAPESPIANDVWKQAMSLDPLIPSKGPGRPDAASVVATKRLEDLAETMRASSALTDTIRKSAMEPTRAAPKGLRTGEEGVDSQHINVWVEERVDAPSEALLRDETYTACFNAGPQVLGNLVPDAESIVPLDDIPESGLNTTWIVTSRTVRLLPHPGEDGIEIDAAEDEEGAVTQWMARFTLRIPRAGHTPIRRIRIVALTEEDPQLTILLVTKPEAAAGQGEVPEEVYRHVTIRLNVESDREDTEPPPAPGMGRTTATAFAQARQVGLRPQHEWQTPAETLMCWACPPQIFVSGTSDGNTVVEPQQYNPAVQVIEHQIQAARQALDKLRIAHQAYFNDVDDTLDAFIRRLTAYRPHRSWMRTNAQIEPSRRQRWQEVARSEELLQLARIGDVLFRELFPTKSLRGYVGNLRSGARIDLMWLKGSTPTWIPHVPWSLLYTLPLPANGEPLDVSGFLGMRLRLAYRSHPIPDRSKSLGTRDKATCACALYWGQGDDTADEVAQHHAVLNHFAGARIVPGGPDHPKTELLDYLRAPEPSPVALIYLYCHCRVGTGAAPTLRFGTTNAAENTVAALEMPREQLPDQPLVFVNACDTLGAHAFTANMLDQVFSYRECRAFIGTECKVPIRLASRFAFAFLHFLYRPDDRGRSTSAGEAFVQAGRFLWDEYRNIGGLFYSYVNQYELFLGSDDDVSLLQEKYGTASGSSIPIE